MISQADIHECYVDKQTHPPHNPDLVPVITTYLEILSIIYMAATEASL